MNKGRINNPNAGDFDDRFNKADKDPFATDHHVQRADHLDEQDEKHDGLLESRARTIGGSLLRRISHAPKHLGPKTSEYNGNPAGAHRAGKKEQP